LTGLAGSATSADEPNLDGRVAIVTGGGRGLGRALVRALAGAGADVGFSYRDSLDLAEETASELQSLGRRVFTARADARRRGEIVAFVEAAAAALGGVDVLVNNIGVFRKVTLEQLSEDDLDEAFDVNVKAAVMACRAAAPHMRQRGGGSIVNIASLGGLRPWPAYLPYSTTKAALVMATQCLAKALAPQIRVNAVAPGLLEEPAPPQSLRETTPLARFGTSDEVAQAVLFLAARASYTTGEVVRVDGGRALL
jgi:7-alpha-hydroxysteroid dehydrogenase